MRHHELSKDIIDDLIRVVMYYEHHNQNNDNIVSVSFIMAFNTLINIGIYTNNNDDDLPINIY